MEISSGFFRRFKNLFPPIYKDCTYRIIKNKLTWIMIVMLLLPTALVFYGGLMEYGTLGLEDKRQSTSIDGDKIYYNEDGEIMHEYLALDIFYGFSTGLGELPGFTLGLFGILLIIMISSEIIGEEYTAKTMNILRTTPISPLEILAYRYLSAVIGAISILGSYTILFYIMVMQFSGIHGIMEELDVLVLVLKLIVLESIAFVGIFCMVAVYTNRAFIISFAYWLLWEGLIPVIAPNVIQKFTVSHYLNSIEFEGAKSLGWDVSESTYFLEDSVGDSIATEPLAATFVFVFIASLTLFLGSIGIANKQF
tara:strand:+ start:1823 stop:2749 length:927 start_codon:yes stop_codon:yes gene_type:complete